MGEVLDSPHNRFLWVVFDSGDGGETTIRTLDYPLLQYVQKRVWRIRVVQTLSNLNNGGGGGCFRAPCILNTHIVLYTDLTGTTVGVTILCSLCLTLFKVIG